MPGTSREEAVKATLKAIEELAGVQLETILPLLYQPDSRLPALLREVDALLKTKKRAKRGKSGLAPLEAQALGYTLEKIAVLAFQGLVGIESAKSYQSAAAQHDLLVTGSDTLWLQVCKTIRIDESQRGILVEAKATKNRLGDHEFERLGNIVAHHFRATVALGVFFAIEGATGFPKAGKSEREISVRACRLTQLVLYHGVKKPVIVLDWADIKSLTEAGSLVRILERRIREIEEQTGLRGSSPIAPVEVDMPKHLKDLCSAKLIGSIE
jgi:hypothetical protein